MQQGQQSNNTQVKGSWVWHESKFNLTTDLAGKPKKLWEVGLSVKPTPENLNKADLALRNLVTTHPLFQKNNSAMHLKWPADEKAVQHWNSELKGWEKFDHDFRGKEICLYMSGHSEDQLTPARYKEYLLTIWKALEEAGVELNYITPAHDEFEVQCESGILSPFCYSEAAQTRRDFYRENKKSPKEFLLTKEQNPHQLFLPFKDKETELTLTAEDLKKYNIRGGHFIIVAYQRLVNQGKEVNDSMTVKHLVGELEKIGTKTEAKKDSNLSFKLPEKCESLQDIMDILNHFCELSAKIKNGYLDLQTSGKNPAPELARYGDAVFFQSKVFLKQANLWSIKFPQFLDQLSMLNNHFEEHKNEISHPKSGSNPNAKLMVNLCSWFEQQKKIIEGELPSWHEKFKAFKYIPTLTVVDINSLITTAYYQNPTRLGEIYVNMVHVEHAHERVCRESQRLKEYQSKCQFAWEKEWPVFSDRDEKRDLENAKKILNVYAASLSLGKHHKNEVKQILNDPTVNTLPCLMERLTKIKLKNREGDLVKIINFIILRISPLYHGVQTSNAATVQPQRLIM